MTKKMLVMFLALISLFSCLVFPASAATVSADNTTQTITVATKSSWLYPGSESITLSQTKGTFSFAETNWFGHETGKTKNRNEYGTWNISVSATDGSHNYTKVWENDTIRLNLKPNKTYKITVTYDGMQDIVRGIEYQNFHWSRYPSWSVKSTARVSGYC